MREKKQNKCTCTVQCTKQTARSKLHEANCTKQTARSKLHEANWLERTTHAIRVALCVTSRHMIPRPLLTSIGSILNYIQPCIKNEIKVMFICSKFLRYDFEFSSKWNMSTNDCYFNIIALVLLVCPIFVKNFVSFKLIESSCLTYTTV